MKFTDIAVFLLGGFFQAVGVSCSVNFFKILLIINSLSKQCVLIDFLFAIPPPVEMLKWGKPPDGCYSDATSLFCFNMNVHSVHQFSCVAVEN